MFLAWGVIAMLVTLGIGRTLRHFEGNESSATGLLGFLVLGNCVLLASVAQGDAWRFVAGESIAYTVAIAVTATLDMVRRSKHSDQSSQIS